jgi:hypothetical protein
MTYKVALPLIVDSDVGDRPEISSIDYQGSEFFTNGSYSSEVVLSPLSEHSSQVFNVKILLRDNNKWRERWTHEEFKIVVLNEEQCKIYNASRGKNNTFRVPFS